MYFPSTKSKPLRSNGFSLVPGSWSFLSFCSSLRFLLQEEKILREMDIAFFFQPQLITSCKFYYREWLSLVFCLAHIPSYEHSLESINSPCFWRSQFLQTVILFAFSLEEQVNTLANFFLLFCSITTLFPFSSKVKNFLCVISSCITRSDCHTLEFNLFRCLMASYF